MKNKDIERANASMINYYEELEIEMSSSTEDIQYQLIELEKLWRKREITRPEIAAKKLGLIFDAKKVFANTTQRNFYDQELKKSFENTENNSNSTQQCQKWIDNAKQYLQSDNIDLCEASLRKASSIKGNDEQEAEIYFLFALMYVRKVKSDIKIEIDSKGTSSSQNLVLLEKAYKDLNDALLLSPNKIGYYELAIEIYTIKYHILVIQGNETEAIKTTTQKRSFLEYAIQRFTGTDKDSEIYLINQYAFSCLREKPLDIKIAERAAKKTAEMGDKSGDAKAILEECEKPKTVSFADLSSYLYTERCELWGDIYNNIAAIKEKYSSSNYLDKGWILAKTDKHHRLTDSNNQNTIDNATFTYILTCQGQFFVVISTYYEKEYGAPNAFHCDSETKKEVFQLKDRPDFAENFVSEFDFKVSFNNPFDKYLSYSCTSAWYWKRMDRFSESDSIIRRLTFTKGKGLLQTVSNILILSKEPEDISIIISDDNKKQSPPNQQANNSVPVSTIDSFNNSNNSSDSNFASATSSSGSIKLEQAPIENTRSKSATVLVLLTISIFLDIVLFVKFFDASKKGMPDSSYVTKGAAMYIITYLLFLWYCYDRADKSMVNNQKHRTVLLSFVVWFVLSFEGITVFFSSMQNSIVLFSVGIGVFTPILIFTGRYIINRLARQKSSRKHDYVG